MKHKQTIAVVESSLDTSVIELAVDGNSGAAGEGVYAVSGSGAEEQEQLADGIEYLAETAGRELGEQPVPRFDLPKLRSFEVMFADNKDYPCKVRGGKQIAFVQENKETADGLGFVYYAHVAKLASVSMLLSRHNRESRRVAVRNVRTAFLQSNKFPPGRKVQGSCH